MMKSLYSLSFASLLVFNGLASEYEYDMNIQPEGETVFFDNFNSGDVFSRWIKSTDEKYSQQNWSLDETLELFSDDMSIVVADRAKHYGLTAKFDKPILNAGKDLVIQYEVALTRSPECGGAYFKFLAADALDEPEDLTADSPYVIMFGPDKCGKMKKVHFIVKHQNPVSGEWEEKHMIDQPEPPLDKDSHLYTLVVRKDNTFQIMIDMKVVREGSMFEEFEPPFNPPAEIDDPTDFKPEDWVDIAEIDDPDAVKPDDWDEDEPFEIEDPAAVKPLQWVDDAFPYIPDPDAEEPEDWDEEEDGEWEAPLVSNPACEAAGCGVWKHPLIQNPKFKGKWTPPKIPNPDYIGEWTPKQIPNPTYFVDESPGTFPAIGYAAIEIWTMSSGVAFDNVLIGYDPEAAKSYAQATFATKILMIKEEELRKQAEADSMRIAAYLDGSFFGMMKYYIFTVAHFLTKNPIAFVSVIIGFTLFMIRLFKKKTNATTDGEVSDAAADGEPKNDSDKVKKKDSKPKKDDEKKKKKSTKEE